jgi:uncharacterized protein (TIGR02996 family)
MTDLEMLRRAVCEQPSDTVARLAYADECEITGLDDLAKFVRLSVGLDGVNQDHFCPFDQSQCKPCRQFRICQDILAENVYPMVHPIAGFPEWQLQPDCDDDYCLELRLEFPRRLATDDEDAEWLYLMWSRGFVDDVIVPFDWFFFRDNCGCFANAAALFGSQPVESVAMHNLRFGGRGQRSDRVVHVNNIDQPSKSDRGFFFFPASFGPFLSGGRPTGDYQDRVYDGYREAEKDVYSACVRWGRRQAGLCDL